jgi:hypothetical protein
VDFCGADIVARFEGHFYGSAAWLAPQIPWMVSIRGTKKLAHLQENLWSSEFDLTPAERKSFTAAITAIPISGDQYPTPQTK